MSIVKKITKPGDYNDVVIEGKNRNADIGLFIENWTTDPIYIKKLHVYNTFVPVIKKGTGPVFVEDQELTGFGGDAININASNFFAQKTRIFDNTPTRPYMKLEMRPRESVEACLDRNDITVYDPKLLKVVYHNGAAWIFGYHQDAIHAYALSKGMYRSTTDDVLSNIVFKELDITMKGSSSQAVAFTECDFKHNVEIGSVSCDIMTDYYYSVIATSASNFIIGADNNGVVNKPVRLQDVKQCGHGFHDVIIHPRGKHVIDQDNTSKIQLLGNQELKPILNKEKSLFELIRDSDEFDTIRSLFGL